MTEPTPTISATRAAALVCILVALASLGCQRAPQQPAPTILLFVADTARQDAVSAYGKATESTPTIDRLAKSGLLYRRAYTNAPWTLPSHASMFSGLFPSEHSVGMTRTLASDSLDMLAERLQRAGVQTLGMSENDWISDTFNMTQGFDHFVTVKHRQSLAVFGRGMTELLKLRDPTRPAFVFVNVMDAHGPFRYQPGNPFLPSDFSPQRARAAADKYSRSMCSAEDLSDVLATVRALYLDGARRADEKLGWLVDELQASEKRRLITIATSDHGHHFGENQIIGHQYSVREELLLVPLVVHGLPDTAPTTIDTPVQHVDLMPSILGWAGVAMDERLARRRLPVANTGGVRPSILAEFSDTAENVKGAKAGMLRLLGLARKRCLPEHRVFGNMRALIQYPFKLIDYERYSSELYELSSSTDTRRDIQASKPEIAARLDTALEELVSSFEPPPGDPVEVPPVPSEVLERLRALGYDLGEENGKGELQ